MAACSLAMVVACGGGGGVVPEGTYEGAVARNADCAFYIDYEIVLLYDGELLNGSDSEYFDSGDGLSFSVFVTLEGPFEPGDSEFELERTDTDGVVQSEPAVFRLDGEQLSIFEGCGGRDVFVPLVKRPYRAPSE